MLEETPRVGAWTNPLTPHMSEVPSDLPWPPKWNDSPPKAGPDREVTITGIVLIAPPNGHPLQHMHVSLCFVLKVSFDRLGAGTLQCCSKTFDQFFVLFVQDLPVEICAIYQKHSPMKQQQQLR